MALFRVGRCHPDHPVLLVSKKADQERSQPVGERTGQTCPIVGSGLEAEREGSCK